MKKLLIGIFSLLVLIGTVQAQTKEELKAAKKALGQATKPLGAYNLDPANNKSKLGEAKDAIVAALDLPAAAGMAKAWQTKGEIFNEIATQMVAAQQLNLGTDDLPKVDNPALQAFEAFEKALSVSEKKYEITDALKGIALVQSNLSNLGVFKYDEKDYSTSFENFSAVLKAHDLLKENGKESSLDTEEDGVSNQMYITGLSALNANRAADAKEYFEKLYEQKFDKPAIYEALYKIYADQDEAKAYNFIDEGRKKYPDDVSLLFADINYHLKANKLDVLITKIEQAIAKEPDNVSLYSTMGNVYDNLYQTAQGAGDAEKSEEYFTKALDYYNQALTKKPDFFDAIYSIGALYYNKAASMTAALNAHSDFSKKGQEKYDQMQKDVKAQFEQALPFFKKAEKMNPSDINTLIALKEIFARSNDFDTSNIFKDRLEKVQGGGTIDAPYFND